MFHIPMSSPMMNMMFGFLSWAWLATTAPVGCYLKRAFTIRLLAFVCLDRVLDFLLHRIEVERRRRLHRRVVDRRRGEFCDYLLNQNEAPELAGKEIVPVAEGAFVRGLAADRWRPLERILPDIDHDGHVRRDLFSRPAPRLLEERELEVIKADGP